MPAPTSRATTSRTTPASSRSMVRICWPADAAALAAIDDPALHAELSRLAPDFVFSFYYRKMLPAPVLGCALRAALNMHGSLLPKYRGRVPVNWAVLHGERETGASLHYMEIKPDAGNLVAQTAVPILGDDTAFEVFQKVTVAAELTLARALPQLIAGTAPSVPLNLKAGSYFSGRKPEDGRIDWTRTAAEVNNLVRAVAPPYPGAFADVGSKRIIVAKARVAAAEAMSSVPVAGQIARTSNGSLGFVCGDGKLLIPLRLIVEDKTLDASASQTWLATVKQ